MSMLPNPPLLKSILPNPPLLMSMLPNLTRPPSHHLDLLETTDMRK